MKQDEVMRKERDGIWQNIFDCTEMDFPMKKQGYLDDYEKISEAEYVSLKASVQNGIQYGNHLAFVHYYLEKCKFEKEVFCEKLNEHIRKAAPDQKDSWFDTILIVVPDLFINYHFELKDEISDAIEQRKALNVFRTQGTLYGWRKGTSLPNNKYLFVQLGLYLNLSSDEVNELLLIAGEQQLYPANGIDFLCSFYLDHFHREECTGRCDLQTGYQYIVELKKKINLFLANYFEGSEDQGKDSNYSFTIKKKKNKGKKQGEEANGIERFELVYLSPLVNKKVEGESSESYSIEDELMYVREKIKIAECEEMDQDTKLFLEKYGTGKITQFYKRELETLTAENVDSFIRAGNAHLQHFTIKYYELQRRLLESVKDIRAYEKNMACDKSLADSKAKITAEKEQCVLPEDLMISEKSCFLNKDCEMIYKRLKGSADNRGVIDDGEKRKVLEAIWGYEEGEKSKNSQAFTQLNQLVFGRQVGNRSENGKGYQADIGRGALVHFCIAAGKEDAMSMLLQLAGFRDFRKGDERSDAFLQYLFDYRDALIDFWMEEQGKNDSMKEQEYREKFPMIALCREVSKDILFVLEYGKGLYKEVKNDVKRSVKDGYWEEKKKLEQLETQLSKAKEQEEAQKTQLNKLLEANPKAKGDIIIPATKKVIHLQNHVNEVKKRLEALNGNKPYRNANLHRTNDKLMNQYYETMVYPIKLERRGERE